ncbi:MAG: (d)CMP kinase, partial [Desulfatiglandales bacterium]
VLNNAQDGWNQRVGELLESFSVEFSGGERTGGVIVGGRDISQFLQDPKVEMLSSDLSRIKEVIDSMLMLQRLEAHKGPLIAEGRDMGTVVFPDASVKFFLTADRDVRAYRRWRERTDKGEKVELGGVLEDLIKRDEQDTQREIAPLVPASDAIIVDTTHKGIDEVLSILCFHITNKLRV